MHLHVVPEDVCVVERLGADATPVGPLPRVGPHVHSQVVPARERLAAHFTSVRVFSSVYSLMSRQV